MDTIKKIIHIDMDAFYASVEQRDRPELRGKPVVVGGNPSSRGVVAACSYEARRFGIHSAMPASRAYKLCPQAVFLRPRFEAYRAASATIMEVFHEYTDLVEPLSLDEAFLDVTHNKHDAPFATRIAQEIRREIRQRTGLTASAGVSYNKFLAKVASDCHKPDGITVITPAEALRFLDQLPIGRFFGIGPKTEERLRACGITNGRELRALREEELADLCGKAGRLFYSICRGVDPRPVCPHRTRKSVGKEITLQEDIDDRDRMMDILAALAKQVTRHLQDHKLRGRTVTLKVRYGDFTTVTRAITLPAATDDPGVILAAADRLLNKTRAGEEMIRLLGITLSHFDNHNQPYRSLHQLRLPIF